MKPENQKSCAVCQVPFQCDMLSGNCWCNNFPKIFKIDSSLECLCPHCLKLATISRINSYVATLTPQTALNNKAKDLPKGPDQIDIDYYIENENVVFTSWYHLKRGYCCKNNCRHCPYGFKKP